MAEEVGLMTVFSSCQKGAALYFYLYACFNPETKYSIPLKRGHFDEDDLCYIRKEIKQGGR